MTSTDEARAVRACEADERRRERAAADLDRLAAMIAGDDSRLRGIVRRALGRSYFAGWANGASWAWAWPDE